MAETAREFPRCSTKEYLEFENDGSLKHEFVNGVVYAMSDASRRHNLIAGDLLTALNVHLPVERCQAYALDAKVHIRDQNEERYFYPDVFVTWSDLDTDQYSSSQPLFVVEVASPSTNEFDRNAKFEAHRQLSSPQEYGLLSQDVRRLDLFRRRTGWTVETYCDDNTVTIESVALTLPVAAIYRRVAFDT